MKINKHAFLVFGLILAFGMSTFPSVSAPGLTVTFWSRGVENDYTGTIAVIGGVKCNLEDLGTCHTVSIDLPVDFFYRSPLTVSSTKQYVWIYTTSDTTPPVTEQSGTVPVDMTGNIFGYYEPQYQVSIVSNPAGGGSTNPSGSGWISAGTMQISASPKAGYKFSSWSTSGSVSVNSASSATTIATISGIGTITANFVGIAQLKTYTIIPSVIGSGSIKPSLPTPVEEGSSQTFTFTPNEGYHIAKVEVDGVAVPTANSYTFNNVKSDHKIAVTFAVSAPNMVPVTIDSTPNGYALIKVDGNLTTTPKIFNWVVGSSHTIIPISIFNVTNGSRYIFSSWNDSQATTLVYVVPSTSAILTAKYDTQYKLTMKTNFGTTTPADGSWYKAGSTVIVSAKAPTAVDGESYVFGGWKGTLGGYSGGVNPSDPIVMNGPVTEETVWQHIYELKIKSAYGSYLNDGWYEDGQVVYAVVNQTLVVENSTSQHMFVGWSGDASGTASTSNSITMNGPKTAKALWETQYRADFTEIGLEGSIFGAVNGVILDVNGTTLKTNKLPYSLWVKGGSVLHYTYNSSVTSTLGGIFGLNSVVGPSSPLTISKPLSVSAVYDLHSFTITQSNLLILIPLIALLVIIIYFLTRRNKEDNKS
jgi:hypothetical protein